MKNNFLYISSLAVSSLLAFSACSDETGVTDNDGGKATIDLTVGMAGTATTRAITSLPEPANLSTLPEGTTLYMVMKSEVGAQTPIWTMTKAVTGTVTDKKSAVSFSDAGTTRYWDDCGARDANVSIYGVCTPNGTPKVPTIGGKNTYTYTATPTTGAWSTEANTLKISDWTVQSNQSALNATTFADQDLCYTNNIYSNSTDDHRLKFNGETKKFDKGDLVFYHALTKVTVNMTAGDGFDAADSKKAFVSPATATIHGFKTQCDFTLADGIVIPEGIDVADITTFLAGIKEVDNAQVVTRSAIIMPGRTLNASDIILTVDGDGNPYDVTAAQLVEAMPTSKTMLQGTEYIINVRINKTGIKVTATIKAWDTVSAAEDTPLIDVTTSYGNTGDGFSEDTEFSFLRSTSIGGSYSNDAIVSYTASNATYEMVPQLYWPNHQIHYFFRGVWPKIAESEGTRQSSVDGTKIAVNNVAYAKGSYPSDLMIGYPRTPDEKCPHDKTIASEGICATRGTIRMNFEYVMSQVEVNLQTNTADGATNKVIFDSNTKVEIIGGYSSGSILLSNGASSFEGKEKADYNMTRNGATDVKYLDAIIPQTISGLKFRITVKDTDGNLDSYETVFGIEQIKVGGKDITTWEPGKHYVYTLTITKTGIDPIATIKDWKVADGGNTNIWM